MTAKPLSFSVSVGNEVSDAEWAAVSALFSSEYGFYSAAAPDRAGERIRLGTGYYRRAYADCQYRVVLCRDEDRLVAHAICLERMTSRGKIAFVVQLVVREVRKIDFDDMDSAVREIFALEPSATMRTDGEFFDSRYILVDEKRHLVCHKEQFPSGAGLPPGEFLIRDRRFTADEISNWLRAAGLEVLQRRFVRAGFKVDYAVSTGKEILILARKVSS